MFEALPHSDPGDGQAIGSTAAKGRRQGQGVETQRLAARVGRTTKIHALVDFRRCPIAIEVTPPGSATFALPSFGQRYPRPDVA
jgi:hypothetical protein